MAWTIICVSLVVVVGSIIEDRKQQHEARAVAMREAQFWATAPVSERRPVSVLRSAE